MSLDLQTQYGPPREISRKNNFLTDATSDVVGNTAAMELWDLIHAPKSLFQHAQRNRTLCHPSLPQPTPEEELRHLTSCQERSDAEKKFASPQLMKSCPKSSSLSLEERLAQALSLAGISTSSSGNLEEDRDLGKDPFLNSSPTSTLQFPIEPEPRSKSPVIFHESDVTFAMRQDFCLDYNSNGHVDEPSHTLVYNSTSTKSETMVSQDLYQHEPTTTNTSEIEQHSETHTFVVCADTQLGTLNQNKEWKKELEYIDRAVDAINDMEIVPSFVSVCGDLVEMEGSIYTNKKGSPYSMEQCNEIQDRQNEDFKRAWSKLDGRIPLVCMCGNHDVGNRPTKTSIDRFKAAFGDEYLAYWTNGTYNIVMNNVLFNDPTGAPDLFDEQIEWLEGRLKYANDHHANQIFVFAHHPWFLYNENETENTLKGKSMFPKEWGVGSIDDSYFSIQPKYRKVALDLFKKYNVSACFSGHFHQNLVSKTSWGMDMIITGPLSITLESDGKPEDSEKNGMGIRIVEVQGREFKHHFEYFDAV